MPPDGEAAACWSSAPVGGRILGGAVRGADRGGHAALTILPPFLARARAAPRPAVSIRGAPASSYGVASARGDRNRWPRGDRVKHFARVSPRARGEPSSRGGGIGVGASYGDAADRQPDRTNKRNYLKAPC